MVRLKDDDDERKRILPDGGRVTVPLWAMDGLQRAVVSAMAADGNVLSLHKPGFRISTDQAAQAARDRAYDAMVKAAENAWKSPAHRAADTEAAADPALDCDDAADPQAIRDQAYLRYVADLETAWRR